jgi:hypothetical protein
VANENDGSFLTIVEFFFFDETKKEQHFATVVQD